MAETISESDARCALDIVAAICAQVGPGLPASPQERLRAGLIQEELARYLGTENVVVEEFSLAPGAFLGSLPLSALCLLAAALLNSAAVRLEGLPPWAISLVALAFACLAILLVILEFILGREFVDPLFPQRQSINVIGTLRKPGAGPVKRLLILGGHHDSALENTWLHYLGYGFLLASAIWIAGLLTMLALSALQLAGILFGNAGLARMGTLGWVLFVFPILPSVIFALFFNMGRKNGGTVPGAVDNLSACAILVALCRFLVSNPAYIPDDAEIRFISFGSEEAGVRGSRRYVARHLEALKRLDARLLNIEMVAHPEIAILATDVNGTVKNDPGMVKSAVTAAERAGVPFKVVPAMFGGPGCDGAPFSQAGIKATTLMPFQMPQQMVALYHQPRDTPAALTVEPLLNVLKLAVEWLRCGGE